MNKKIIFLDGEWQHYKNVQKRLNISSQDPLAFSGPCLAVQFDVVHVLA